MARSRTAEKKAVTTFHGASASLRPTGVLRYFGAAFLLVWLAGWAVGEVVALGFLVMLVRSIVGSAIGATWPVPGGDWIVGGAAGFVLLFLIVWLTLWTFGGFAAIRELLRSLAGEDRISVESMAVEVQHRAGPFRRTRNVERSHVRGVRLRRHDKAVMLDTASGSEVVTTFGSIDERKSLAEWLRSRLLLQPAATRIDPSAAPPGWRMTVEGGTTQLTQDDPRARAIGAGILWFIVAMLTLMVIGAEGTAAGRAVAAVITLLMAAAATWFTFSRRAWLVRQAGLTAHTRFLAWERTREFKSARLEVAVSTDSDNDEHYRLDVTDSQGTRKIASRLHDEGEIVSLGEWLALRTGFPLTLPHKLRS